MTHGNGNNGMGSMFDELDISQEVLEEMFSGKECDCSICTGSIDPLAIYERMYSVDGIRLNAEKKRSDELDSAMSGLHNLSSRLAEALKKEREENARLDAEFHELEEEAHGLQSKIDSLEREQVAILDDVVKECRRGDNLFNEVQDLGFKRKMIVEHLGFFAGMPKKKQTKAAYQKLVTDITRILDSDDSTDQEPATGGC